MLHPLSAPLLVGSVALAIAGASILVVALLVGAAAGNELVSAFGLTRP